MNCEILAVGTELLLGTSVDTNSAWISEQLAGAGIGVFFHTTVGDNHDRIVAALRAALDRSDAVILTGGLGPTHDDITREAIAEVMGVGMLSDPAQEMRIRAIFEARRREMSLNNLKQAQRPEGSQLIEHARGTAPGLICPVGDKVVYALPGVPHEMQDMVERTVVPDLVARGGVAGVILSRTLRTWGVSESALAEMVEPRVQALDVAENPTLALLAKGIEGVHVRITARAETPETALAMLSAEETELRVILGPLVFGTDDQSMEFAVANLLLDRELSLGLAESVTGGMVASRLTAIPGGSGWLRGGIVSYATDVKQSLLDVPEGPVVSATAAIAMAEGACRVLGSEIGLSVTGVAGPTQQDDQPVGTVFAGLALPWADTEVIEFHLVGDRQRIRELACINVLDTLRRRLLAQPTNG